MMNRLNKTKGSITEATESTRFMGGLGESLWASRGSGRAVVRVQGDQEA